ncbi:MAG: crossover junction endodeoxyribonuclease RuvC [Bacteroidetes bacterium]|nr:crossover junction endodeoxyribonuclease RuvC [Bacteroidota bacterium]
MAKPTNALSHILVLLFKSIFLLQQNPQIILGIDPGTLVMGYGLIRVDKNSISLLEMGVLQLAKRQDHAERLELIFRKMEMLIKTHQPSSVAIEAPFFGKNVQSMLKLGRAQGVAIAAAMMHGLAAEEYAPRKIKQSITGKGNATKEQVWQMLQHTLKLEEDPRFFDATDAVAVALCHHYQNRLPTPKTEGPTRISTAKKRNNWEAFLSENPQRIKKS